MSFKALDHSTALRDPVGFAKAAKAAGYVAVGRYLPLPPGTLYGDSVGRLTLTEVAACHAEGLGLFVIYERDTQNHHRPLDGASAGFTDGSAARNFAIALGFPPDFPIFGAADFNPTPDEYPVIADYFRAGAFQPYANGPLLTYLAQAGIVHSWMHNWGGSGYADCHIHQQGGQVTIAGVVCDLNDVYNPDCIWWPPGVQAPVQIQSASPAVPAPPPTTPEEDLMPMLSATDPKNGCHALCDRDTGAVFCYNPDWTQGGHYLGGANRPDWNIGPVVAFEFFDDRNPAYSDRSAYIIMRQAPDGTPHPYSFPSSGVLAK